jgi:thioredoxin-dependent peroxiredoxin
MSGRVNLITLAAVLLVAGLRSIVLGAQSSPMAMQEVTPREGQQAPEFSLGALDGTTVRLATEVARGPVVLVVLRGWPGYQCPFCTRQFSEYMARAADLEATGAHVLFIYPGPAEDLKEHAEAVTKKASLPPAYRVLLDPGFTFTQAYGLRWDAPNETAYPSTFVVDTHGTITFARTSHSHGDRVPVAEVLKALAQLGR